MTVPKRPVLVVIPTYNEVENIQGAVEQVLQTECRADVLVMDDGSPDGTGNLVAEIAAVEDRVHLVRRTGKLGLGSAYIAGFKWGLERGYDVLVEMDADGSHPVSRLPALLDALDGTGKSAPVLAIGSRWTKGGSVVDWPKHRELLSRAGNAYARLALSLKVADVTAGFRAYRSSVIARMDLDAIDSKGYCFQIDMTLRVRDIGGQIAEIPIEFKDRQLGESKMSRAIVLEAMLQTTRWGLTRRFARTWYCK